MALKTSGRQNLKQPSPKSKRVAQLKSRPAAKQTQTPASFFREEEQARFVQEKQEEMKKLQLEMKESITANNEYLDLIDSLQFDNQALLNKISELQSEPSSHRSSKKNVSLKR
mmetsp:Transcript_32074/g.49046  ORF Transcript_32074/g.49046 Transcript_32074/m.49046 type:complete len:113 (-) Transcript_32074:118-456(-)|eukprot:CAMPEP_0170485242 /NCGR_PEP_ID=MMETSP0208-20121228/4555_1 /TAXON_ID=197538 /ORGANISM="Strombidium inclinatum, Strain S3" /LENGTH=112 /DNA_ID=CAMNT_0010758837 /DNA_START=876 /DNA_END=1214 /DNA_ORIENTATION=+